MTTLTADALVVGECYTRIGGATGNNTSEKYMGVYMDKDQTNSGEEVYAFENGSINVDSAVNFTFRQEDCPIKNEGANNNSVMETAPGGMAVVGGRRSRKSRSRSRKSRKSRKSRCYKN